MSSAPDFVEPVLGFRVWTVRSDGGLYPYSHLELGAWSAGQNTAVCSRFPPPTEDGPIPHDAPDANCRCGLYAFRSLGNQGLRFYSHEGATASPVVGAIAAWGDLQVHRTGFRAQHACVLALASHPRMAACERALAERAADRYGVPLVPWRRLERQASQHARSLPDIRPRARPRRRALQERSHLPGGFRRERRDVGVGRPDPGATGYALDHHVWVTRGEEDCVIGITAELASRLGSVRGLEPPPVRDRIGRGGVLARIRAGGEVLTVTSPLSGRVAAINRMLFDDPGLLSEDPEEDGWIARLVPTKFETEADGLVWGTVGALEYAAHARDRGDGLLADLHPGLPPETPSVSSWAEVKAALLAVPHRPRYGSAEDFYAGVARPVQRRVGSSPALLSELSRFGMVAVFRIREPEATLTLRLTGDGVSLRSGFEAEGPDMVLAMTGDLAAEYWSGHFDSVAAVRRGEITLDGELERVAELDAAISLLGEDGTRRHLV